MRIRNEKLYTRDYQLQTLLRDATLLATSMHVLSSTFSTDLQPQENIIYIQSLLSRSRET